MALLYRIDFAEPHAGELKDHWHEKRRGDSPLPTLLRTARASRAAWLERPEVRCAQLHAKQFAPGFALMWSATDRIPAPDLGEFVASLADPSTPDTSDLAAFAAAYTEVRHARWERAAAAFVGAKRLPLRVSLPGHGHCQNGCKDW